MKQTKKIIVIRIFSWGLLCQCPCSPSEPEPVPTSPGGLPVLLGQSLDLLWTLWGQLRPWPGLTPLCSCHQSPLLQRPDQSQLWEHSLSIQVFHRCGIYQANLGDLIHGLCSCTERFPFLFLSRTAPGAQLLFWPRIRLCTILRHLFPAQLRGSESSGCLGLGWGTEGTVGVFVSCLQQQGPAGHCNRLWHARCARSTSQRPWRQELACGGRGSPPHSPLNNDASLSRQTTPPLGAFRATHPLTPVPSAVSAQPTELLSLICSPNPTL